MENNGDFTVKMTIETNFIDFMCHTSHNLEELTIRQNAWSEFCGQEICKAMITNDVKSLRRVKIEDQPNWFDSVEKCQAWAELFARQKNLVKVYLGDNGFKKQRELWKILKGSCDGKKTDISFR